LAKTQGGCILSKIDRLLAIIDKKFSFLIKQTSETAEKKCMAILRAVYWIDHSQEMQDAAHDDFNKFVLEKIKGNKTAADHYSTIASQVRGNF